MGIGVQIATSGFPARHRWRVKPRCSSCAFKSRPLMLPIAGDRLRVIACHQQMPSTREHRAIRFFENTDVWSDVRKVAPRQSGTPVV